MTASTKAYVFILILALALISRESSALRKFHVHILNKMSGQLMIVCKSKDTDLGQHVLQINQEFQWSFHPNIVGTTLFWCDFWWDSRYGHYDVFVARRDLFKCGDDKQCRWHVHDDGLYFLNHDTGKYDLKYPWPAQPASGDQNIVGRLECHLSRTLAFHCFLFSSVPIMHAFSL